MINILIISIYIFLMSQFLISGFDNIVPKNNEYFILNIFCVFLFSSFFYIFLPFKYLVSIISIVFFYILSLVIYYISEFRGINFNYSDIKSIKTAKEVAGGYKYKIEPRFVVIFIINALIVYGFMSIPLNSQTFRLQTNFDFFEYFIRGSMHIILFIFRALVFILIFIYLRWKISIEYFNYSIFAGENEGYIYNFVSSIPIFHTIKNYDEDVFDYKSINFNIDKISNVNDFDNSSFPHIIVIMNESFGNINENINTNICVTPYFNSLNKVKKGNLLVNTFGGGTSNTEFEFLTGIHIGNMTYPIYPYNDLIKVNKYSIAKYFKNLNYDTIALHPYTKTNYNRDIVYKKFGFDKFLSIEDFNYNKRIRNFISDESMYQQVESIFENYKFNNKKLFLFGITIQNHSGYNSFDEQKVVSLNDNNEILNSYLSLLYISDDALKHLIEYFNNQDEHVVICFFGDHNASFGMDLNKKYYKYDKEYENSNAYKTPYFIYDNKNDLNNNNSNITSTNFLMNELLNMYNFPLDDWQEILKRIHSNIEFMNFHKCKMNNKTQLSYINETCDEYLFYQREFFK